MSAPLSHVDVRARLLGTMVFVVATASLPLTATRAMAAHALVLLGLLVVAQAPVATTLRRVLLAAMWGCALALSRWLFARTMDASSGALMAARVTLTLAATLPLVATTTSLALVEALAALRLPSALVATTAATARGLVLLGDEAERLSRARQLRAPYATVWKRLPLYGSMVAVLFERGLRRAERSQSAMTMRGFDPARPRPFARIPTRDVALLLAFAVGLFALRWLDRP